MMSLPTCDSPLYWSGCYSEDAKLKPFLDPATIRHPAKMAPGLLSRIFKHMIDTGLLAPGTTIVDFMGGTGRTAVEAARRGYKSVTVELEPRFVEFQKLNKATAEKALGRTVDWEILQGDARRLSEILNTTGTAIVSPPYADVIGLGGGHDRHPERLQGGPLRTKERYGDGPGNIGNLKAGVISPPYGQTEGTLHPSKFKDPEKFIEIMGERQRAGKAGGHLATAEARMRYVEAQPKGYESKDRANIGNLAGVTSPPFMDSLHTYGDKPPEFWEKMAENTGRKAWTNPTGTTRKTIEGQNAGYAGVTSPPYMDAQSGGGISKNGYKGPSGRIDDVQNRSYIPETHGTTEGQIGVVKPETYWEAMRTVYTEAFKCGISPLVVVTKDPTRNKAIVPLGATTAILLQSCGYRIVDHHRAVLFEERHQATLDGDIHKSVSGRVSFFKRLSIAKGSPAARWEDVLFAVKP